MDVALLTLIVAIIGVVMGGIHFFYTIRGDKLHMKVDLSSSVMTFHSHPGVKQRRVYVQIKNVGRNYIVYDYYEIRVGGLSLRGGFQNNNNMFTLYTGGFRHSEVKSFSKFIKENALEGDVLAQAFVYDIEGHVFKGKKITIPTHDIPDPDDEIA